MLSPRAPLFSVSLAFASGCLLGLDGVVSLAPALGAAFIAGIAWLILGRFPQASLISCYCFTACAGLVHTLLIASSIPASDLRRLPDEKALETTQWRGMIIEEPVSQMTPHYTRRSLDRTTFVLRMQEWRSTSGRLFGSDVDTPWQLAEGDVRCTVVGPAGELRCGDRLEFAAPLETIPRPLCPGGLDLRDYEARQGIYYEVTLTGTNWRRIETGGGNWWQNLSFRARDWAYARLQIGLEDDPRTADFLAGMLIGYRQEIPTDIEQDFRRTGTIHVFAVSGQNIAEMAAVALVLLQICGLVRWRWAWLIVPLLLLYCLLTGSPSSAVRATVMALSVLLAWRLERPLNALSCWSLALLVLLIWNPSILLDPGAQLSFGVVLGLILVSPPILHFFIRPFLTDPYLPPRLLLPHHRFELRFWWSGTALLSTGIAAVLISEPITALEFHQVTPISVLANLIVVPLAGIITVIGTMSVAVSLVSATLAGLLNNSNWLLARGLILIVGYLAHLPGAAVNVPDLSIIGEPKPAFIVAPLRDSACLLVRTADQTWLINTGRESPTPSTVWHLLQFYGINRLDGVVLAQMSAADNSGAAAIVRDFHPRHFVVPALSTHSPMEKTMPALIALAGGKSESWQRGEVVPLGSRISVEVLNPAGDSAESHAADRGLVLLFHDGGQTLMWAGYIAASTQRDLLQAYPTLHADVLIMSGDSKPTEDWLRTLQVRDWLQIPPRDRMLNAVGTGDIPEFCQLWPLNKTGAVTVHFKAPKHNQPPQIILKPWIPLSSL